MHLASALSQPLVAVYTSENPEVTGPYGNIETLQIAKPDLGCFPCVNKKHQHQCEKNKICVDYLTASSVYDQSKSFIKKYISFSKK